MTEPPVERGAGSGSEEAKNIRAPFQALGKPSFLDFSLNITSEVLRSIGRSLEAQGELLARLKACRTSPEMVDVYDRFISEAVNNFQSESAKFREHVLQTVSDVRRNP